LCYNTCAIVFKKLQKEKAMEIKEIAQVGKPAPYFSMLSTKDMQTLDKIITLNDYQGQWLILFFYPYDFSFICPTEILALSDRYDDFKALHTEILGVSTDSVYAHRAWLETPEEENGVKGTKFPLASDQTHAVSEAYGVLDKKEGVALRGLFIIDPEGILQYIVVHNYNIGRSIDETERVLEALQSGGLCGANWQPGDEML
jgi:peroxiredoxin (alkyl hydroperoxide reductase subunit C)